MHVMSEPCVVRSWDIPIGILPDSVDPDRLYILPSRPDRSGMLAYPTEVMYIQKGAASCGAAIEYSVDSQDRRFVDHFSAVSAAEVWLAFAGPITDMVLFGLTYAVSALAKRHAGGEPDREVPVRIAIAELDTVGGTHRGIVIEGNVDDVQKAIRELKNGT